MNTCERERDGFKPAYHGRGLELILEMSAEVVGFGRRPSASAVSPGPPGGTVVP